MDKILIFLEVPSISEKYEVSVPIHLKVKDVSTLLIRAVSELSERAYFGSDQALLCIKEYNSALPENSTISELGIKNGDHLVLI